MTLRRYLQQDPTLSSGTQQGDDEGASSRRITAVYTTLIVLFVVGMAIIFGFRWMWGWRLTKKKQKKSVRVVGDMELKEQRKLHMLDESTTNSSVLDAPKQMAWITENEMRQLLSPFSIVSILRNVGLEKEATH